MGLTREPAFGGAVRQGIQRRALRVLLPGFVAGFLSGVAWAESGEAGQPAPASANWLLGRWARSVEACSQPELVFEAGRATVFVDADGTPTSFRYPDVSYAVGASCITARLGKRHPYSKTPKNAALSFELKPDGAVRLQRLKGKTATFVRCPPAAQNHGNPVHG